MEKSHTKGYFDINKYWMLGIALLGICIKLFLSCCQYVTVYPPLAPLDDDLMFRAAQSIVNGQWLGQYTYLTISKHMFFSFWLAFLHVIKIPYLVGNMALWALASFSFTAAVSPLIKRNIKKLILFLALLYNPATSAGFSTRIYRDSIFPALCIFFFAGVIAVGLRYKRPIKSWIGWCILYGIAFGTIYLCREDGIWVIPFAIAAFTVVILCTVIEKNGKVLQRTIALILPFCLSLAIILVYCYENQKYYGRFIVSDFTSSEFKSAYGALTSLEQDSWDPMVSVPEDVRQDVYENIEMFAPVEEALNHPLIINGYKNEVINDFFSGAFYWALRNALSNLGVYDTPQSAQEYYEQLTEEIQLAVDEGRLKTQNGKTSLRKAITPPIKSDYVLPVFVEGMVSFKTSLLFEQCDPMAQKAVGTVEEISTVEDFIYQGGATVLMENSDIPFVSPLRSVIYKALRVVNTIYSIFIPILFAISLLWQIKQLIYDVVNHRFTSESMLNIVLLGLLGMALLRCAMIAFVEVSSFGIGTYGMYLSTVYPLLIAYGFIGYLKTFE